MPLPGKNGQQSLMSTLLSAAIGGIIKQLGEAIRSQNRKQLPPGTQSKLIEEHQDEQANK
jgi:hypothetical protein